MPQRATILGRISYKVVQMFLIHCFDNRPIWRLIWTAICVRCILLARIPLAGASAKGKHYLRHLEEKEANPQAPLIIATHYPCGWFEGQPESTVIGHGKQVVDHLVANDRMAIHFHFSVGQDDRISVFVYDPGELAQSHAIIKRAYRAAKRFQGRLVRKYELERIPTNEIVLADEVYGPPIGDDMLVVQKHFSIGDTFEIAQKLNGGNKVNVECVQKVYNPNY